MSPFSPAGRAGLEEGDILVQISGWRTEAMDRHQAALNVFLAAGYLVEVGWLKAKLETKYNGPDWNQLDLL